MSISEHLGEVGASRSISRRGYSRYWCAIWAIALAINVACWFGYFSPQIQTDSWLLVLIAWLYWRLYANGVLP